MTNKADHTVTVAQSTAATAEIVELILAEFSALPALVSDIPAEQERVVEAIVMVRLRLIDKLQARALEQAKGAFMAAFLPPPADLN